MLESYVLRRLNEFIVEISIVKVQNNLCRKAFSKIRCSAYLVFFGFSRLRTIKIEPAVDLTRPLANNRLIVLSTSIWIVASNVNTLFHIYGLLPKYE